PDDQRDALGLTSRPADQLGHLAHQLDGHVVDDEPSEVVERVRGGRPARPTHPGDDQELTHRICLYQFSHDPETVVVMQTNAQAFFAALPSNSTAKAAKKQLDLLASRQYGLLERSQVLAIVGSEAFIDNQLKQGRWSIRHPDVYLVVGSPWSYEQDLLAALLAAGPAAVVSHRSALWLRGVGPRKLDLVEITVPLAQAPRLKGVIIRRSMDVHRAEVAIVRGIRVTNPLRALI